MSSRHIQSFHIDVCVLEDLHAGSGLGGADIDALLALDREGRPTIRWSHLRGLLKQALLDRCDALEIAPEDDLVTLFGTPQTGPSQAFHRGALMGHSLRPAGAWGTPIVWASTARKPRTRVPKTESLRRVEYVPAGTKFSGCVRICGDGKSGDLVATLLRRVNRLGGDRRRGAGLVRLTASPSTMEPVVVQEDPKVGAPNSVGHRVLFRALDPVGLAATSEPGNVIRGHSHMSPATVHGMLVRWAMESGNTAFAQMLLDRRVVCGPAYPVPPQAMESPLGVLDVVPFPLSFQAGKPLPQHDGWPWWAMPAMPDGWIDTLPGSGQPDAQPRPEKLKRPGEHDYLVHTASGWMRFGCNPGQSMRNDAGTSQRGDGLKQNLRTVEEVPEDTGFLTRIVATDAPAEALLQPILRELQQSGHWLQAGRGGAPMVVQAHEEVVVKSASPSGTGDQPADSLTDTAVRIFVESDLILRAPDLRFHTRLDRATILALLEQASTAADDLMGLCNDLTSVEEVSEPTEIRGRNVATSGPRLPALAIRRGSEAMLYFNNPERAEQCRKILAAIARHGVGERSAEGHGRLRVDFAPTFNGPKRAVRTDGIHADEALLEDVSTWLGGKGMDPKLFTSTRWQSLRNAARANDPRTISQWFDQASREQKRLAAKGTAGAEALEAWLNQLKARVTEGHGVTGALRPELRLFLRMLGLLAARQVKSLRGADGPANPGVQP